MLKQMGGTSCTAGRGLPAAVLPQWNAEEGAARSLRASLRPLYDRKKGQATRRRTGVIKITPGKISVSNPPAPSRTGLEIEHTRHFASDKMLAPRLLTHRTDSQHPRQQGEPVERLSSSDE